MNTSFYIMAVAILAGAVASVMAEFGVIALVNKIISPVMRPLFGLSGAAALGAVTTYISDNPAILALAADEEFDRYFTPAEKATYTNLGTTFGMGLIVTAYMLSLGKAYFSAVLIGNIGAIIGGIFSVRVMLLIAKKYYKEDRKYKITTKDASLNMRKIRSGGTFERFMSALMDGAKSGVTLGLACASGTVLICTFVMILTFGPAGANGEYLGVAYEGVKLLPRIGAYFLPVARFLWGFNVPELLVYPFTALGAVGSAMGLTKGFLAAGLANAGTVATFTGMGICMSGFLSTHIGMLDTLKQT
ncbi:CD0519/CD1768 family membrane protein [Treponema maltophilum]|uniref:CD0519/CD1768 family membrane protein n=1 Tax=Treponema maltophilum TaxID=51160 RepID=UPI003D8AFD9E